MEAAAGSVSAPSAELVERWEKEYSPSEWTKRFRTAGEVIDHHVKFVTEGWSASDSIRID